MLRMLSDTIELVLRESGVDRRTVYVGIEVLGPDGGVIRAESSDENVALEIERRLPEQAGEPGARIEIRVLPGENDIPRLLTVSGSVADVRKEPSHASELLTQAISSEFLEPLKVKGDWFLVRCDDGYIGWVRSWSVMSCDQRRRREFLEKAAFRVVENVVSVLESPSSQALPISEATAGTMVSAEGSPKRGWMKVELSDGRSGYVRSRSLERAVVGRPISRRKLAKTGLRFLGVPYLWGGTTSKGFDCSGLVQRIFKMNGKILPRDSDMQATVGNLKPNRKMEELSTGDLLFFGEDPGRITHVGMYVSESLFLHAHGKVRLSSLDRQNPLFHPSLYEKWLSARDPLRT